MKLFPLFLAGLPLAAAAGTLKVFVLAGQSNMEGHAEVATLDKTTGKPLNGTLLYQTTDPRTMKEFGPLRQGGSWKVLDNVKVHCVRAYFCSRSRSLVSRFGSMRPWVARNKARTAP
jgi:hypothetical protein